MKYLLSESKQRTTSSGNFGSGSGTSRGLGDRPSSGSDSVETAHCSGALHQEGGGLNSANFVDQIAEAVIRKIDSQTGGINPRWRYYERSEPTIATVAPSNTEPPPHFTTPIVETDMNDSFDEVNLLKKVPKPFKKNASLLLKEFDQRPNELTWDSNGHIYIEEKVIPNANIFVLFPRLFNKRATKQTPGMADFLDKLSSMGLNHLVRSDLHRTTAKTPKKETTSKTSSQNWWYIGE